MGGWAHPFPPSLLSPRPPVPAPCGNSRWCACALSAGHGGRPQACSCCCLRPGATRPRARTPAAGPPLCFAPKAQGTAPPPPPRRQRSEEYALPGPVPGPRQFAQKCGCRRSPGSWSFPFWAGASPRIVRCFRVSCREQQGCAWCPSPLAHTPQRPWAVAPACAGGGSLNLVQASPFFSCLQGSARWWSCRCAQDMPF